MVLSTLVYFVLPPENYFKVFEETLLDRIDDIYEMKEE